MKRTARPPLNGLEKSKNEVKRLSDEAVEILRVSEKSEEFLIPLVIWMISRKK